MVYNSLSCYVMIERKKYPRDCRWSERIETVNIYDYWIFNAAYPDV